MSSDSSVETYLDSSFELSSDFSSPSNIPLPFFVYRVFNPQSNETWKEFSEEKDGFDRNMLLSTFMATREDLRGLKFVTGVIVPAAYLGQVEFQFSHEYEQCTGSMTLGSIANQGGVCLVFEDHREAFMKCVDATPSAFHLIHEHMRKNNLDGSYLDLFYKMDDPTDFTHFALHDHNIFPSTDELPAFVHAKKQQMESRRNWSHWGQSDLESHVKTHFEEVGLEYTEFTVLQPPSPGDSTFGHDFSSSSHSPTLRLRYKEIDFLTTLSKNYNKRDNTINASIQGIFSCLFDYASLVYESPPQPVLKLRMPLPNSDWPNNMGIVTVAKRPKPGARKHLQKHLHFIHPRSDASLFWGHEIVFLADIDSYKTSFQRTMAQAAFWVRIMNHTLHTNVCLPVFWISDLSVMSDMDGWAGECYLVYEQNSNVYYHRLHYTPPGMDHQLPNFPLADVHSRAHFHLRLLNAADPRNRQFDILQQLTMVKLWKKLRAVAHEGNKRNINGQVIGKRKLDALRSLSEDSVFRLKKIGRHGIYYIEFDTGKRYIRKLIRHSGRQELRIYKCLQEHGHSTVPGINQFIPEWSIGFWFYGEYLQLPHLIPVTQEMEETESCLHSHALLLCKQLSDGVSFLHTQLQVAHMDIKPDNLVLDISCDNSQVTLKIIDFNLSIMCANRMIRGVRGTEGYMAPEVEGCKWYRPFLADRYSCGICMEMFLEQGQEENLESRCSCCTAVAVFARRLHTWSPDRRPLLTDFPQQHSCHCRPLH